MNDAPAVPGDLAPAGARLWSSVVDDYELEEHEMSLLLQACRTVDVLDELAAAVERDGVLVEGPSGQRSRPAAIEARLQRIALARVLAALRLPAGADGDRQAGARPPRRVGVRGVYGVRGVIS